MNHFLLLSLFAAAQSRHSLPVEEPQTSGIVYSPVNVWPYPKSITFGDAADGPHALQVAASGVTIHGCHRDLSAFVTESTEGVTRTFRSPARSYDNQPYALVDKACDSKCSTNADCGGGMCFTQSSRRWNSTHACPPSSQFSSPCGCCVKGSALPIISTITITCTDDKQSKSSSYTNGARAKTAAASENANYELNITTTGVSIVAATSQGNKVCEVGMSCV